VTDDEEEEDYFNFIPEDLEHHFLNFWEDVIPVFEKYGQISSFWVAMYVGVQLASLLGFFYWFWNF
jgi:hypothetical protein